MSVSTASTKSIIDPLNHYKSNQYNTSGQNDQLSKICNINKLSINKLSPTNSTDSQNAEYITRQSSDNKSYITTAQPTPTCGLPSVDKIGNMTTKREEIPRNESLLQNSPYHSKSTQHQAKAIQHQQMKNSATQTDDKSKVFDRLQSTRPSIVQATQNESIENSNLNWNATSNNNQNHKPPMIDPKYPAVNGSLDKSNPNHHHLLMSSEEDFSSTSTPQTPGNEPNYNTLDYNNQMTSQLNLNPYSPNNNFLIMQPAEIHQTINVAPFQRGNELNLFVENGIDPIQTPPPNQQFNAVPQQSHHQMSLHFGKQRNTCKFFASGHCSRGSNCHFLHVASQPFKMNETENLFGQPISDTTSAITSRFLTSQSQIPPEFTRMNTGPFQINSAASSWGPGNLNNPKAIQLQSLIQARASQPSNPTRLTFADQQQTRSVSSVIPVGNQLMIAESIPNAFATPQTAQTNMAINHSFDTTSTIHQQQGQFSPFQNFPPNAFHFTNEQVLGDPNLFVTGDGPYLVSFPSYSTSANNVYQTSQSNPMTYINKFQPVNNQQMIQEVRQAHAFDYTPYYNARFPASFADDTMRYTIEDLKGRIASLAVDQFGCRLLQRMIDTSISPTSNASPTGNSVMNLILVEALPCLSHLMCNPFGNYLTQKLVQFSDHHQRLQIISAIQPSLVDICFNMHGTRAIQQLVSVIENHDEIQIITNQLKTKTLALIFDLNANHVIQKCLTHLKNSDNQFIFDTIFNNLIQCSIHKHGVCVLQRCIEFSNQEQKQILTDQILKNALQLVQDAYANYAVQFVLDLKTPQWTSQLIKVLIPHIIPLSQQKFSSNVVEKCLELGDENDKKIIINEFMHSSEALLQLLTDPFANYCIQKALSVANKIQFQRLSTIIRPHLLSLKNTNFGKRIQSKIIKRFPDLHHSDHSMIQNNHYQSNFHPKINQPKHDNSTVKVHKSIQPSAFTFQNPTVFTSNSLKIHQEGQRQQFSKQMENHFGNKSYNRHRNGNGNENKNENENGTENNSNFLNNQNQPKLTNISLNENQKQSNESN